MAILISFSLRAYEIAHWATHCTLYRLIRSDCIGHSSCECKEIITIACLSYRVWYI